MKRLSAMALLYLAIPLFSSAKIINGYRVDLMVARKTVDNLQAIFQDEQLTYDQRKNVQSLYSEVQERYEEILAHYERTLHILDAMNKIYPELYAEIDNIRDRHGSNSDVYIRVVPGECLGKNVLGTTNLDQAPDDPHIYRSEFGLRTVSVKVRDCTRYATLQLLVHELAHVKYQVPHLAAYAEFFKKVYTHGQYNNGIGHAPGDPSGATVEAEMKRYFALYSERKHRLRGDYEQPETTLASGIPADIP